MMHYSSYSASTTPYNIKEFLDSLNGWYDPDSFLKHLCEVIDDPNQAVNLLSLCNCCTRHTINRPLKLELWYNTNSNNNQSTQCECSCRSTSRQICRAFRGEKPFDIYNSNNNIITTIKDNTKRTYIGLDEIPPKMPRYY